MRRRPNLAFVSPLLVNGHRNCLPSANRCPGIRQRPSQFVSTKQRACFSATAAKEVVQVGQIVAVERGRGIVDIARVTGVSSSGDTVDIVLLEEFVKEMYIESKQPPTYEPVQNVRPVIHEYAPTQQGWIVLNQDLQTVKTYFENRAAQKIKEKAVVVTQASPRKLDETALARQYFRPTRSQAFWGAAGSLPLSALCYSAFASARQAYAANPAGDDFLSGDIFRKLVLFASGAASVAALVVGSALFLYALSKTDDE